MHRSFLRRHARLTLLAGSSAILLAGCSGQPLDFDLRGLGGGFSTADAATQPLASRPDPDNRGVISYPNYQVAVARRGDTLEDVAARVGADPSTLASYNGIEVDVALRKDEIIALPSRVAEPSLATGAAGNGPIQPLDISSIAQGAIARAPDTTSNVQTATLPPVAQTTPKAEPVLSGKEPIRHQVERGETAYTIARLYAVPVKDLAEWNGLGADFALREGQFLLIPVPQQNPPKRAASAASAAPVQTAAVAPATTLPGAGSPTPTPPSAATPLPRDTTAKPLTAKEKAAPEKPVADVGKATATVSAATLQPPVRGSIIRGYTKGRNEGINIKATAGTPVTAADAGVVAAITKNAEGVPIVVVRHADNLLTVYANVTDVSVAKGDSVKRGQAIARLRSGDNAYVHFEVRKGFDSVDPEPFING